MNRKERSKELDDNGNRRIRGKQLHNIRSRSFHPLNQGKQSDSSFPSRVLHPDRGEIGGFKVRVPKGGKKKVSEEFK